MIQDYLDWAAEQVGIARLIAYLLPVVAVVSLVGGVFAYATKDDGGGSSNLATGQPTPLRTATVLATVAQPGNLTPLVPLGTPGGTPRPPGSPVAGTPGPAGTPPPAGTAPAGTPRPAGSPAATTPGPGATTAPAGATYTVVSGDTGFGIAGKLNIPAAQQTQWIADVARLNDLPNLNTLRVGQVLKLPPPAAPAAPAATPRP